MTRRAVVIGAGIAGLAGAALLAREGYVVEVVEQQDAVGGRAATWRHAGFTFDLGPSWYLMPEVFDHFFRLCGTSAAAELDLVALDPAYRVLREPSSGPGTAEALDVRTGHARELFEAREPGAGERLDAYLASAGETYDLAVREFLYRTWASPSALLDAELLRRAPTLARLLGTSLERFIGRRFSDPLLRQVLGYPAVFLGTAPDRAPALYHLMSHADLTTGVLYPRGGFGTVIDAVARCARRTGVVVHTSTQATGICTRTSNGRAHVTGVEVAAGGRSWVIPADVVLGAGDLHDLETRLVPAPLRTYPERWWRRRDPGPGAVLVHLGVRGRVPQLTHHTMFFTRDWRTNFDAILGPRPRVPSPASMYVCAPSRTDPGVAPPDHENLFVLVPVPAQTAIGSGGLDGGGDPVVEQVADEAIAAISRWAGVPDLASRIVVRRTVGPADFARDLSSWSGGALGPAHTLRQSAMLRGRNASAHVDGLLYAGGSTIPGIGLPMCLISAELAVKRLRGDASPHPLEPHPHEQHPLELHPREQHPLDQRAVIA
ncbi:phytoene desaturase family protein [Cellulomonas composti]|uniref:Phytoene desaturase n=1 Tax=Cellulomonas composti TaxID=266130 RepID=A0A511J7M6_9CELL|nr:phytoene desaturase family protein [Cellulomonas composti]GEL93719.1 phytoene desaturase [Cellulomonas composti]